MVEVLRALVAKGADLERRFTLGSKSTSALGLAIRNHQEAAALYLLKEAGAAWDISGMSEDIDRALIHAGGNREVAVGGALLAFGAGYNVPGVLKHLLQKMQARGVSQELFDKKVGVAVGNAVTNGATVSLRALIEEGLDVKEARMDWQGLLHMAALRGERDAAALLLDRGCDPLQCESMGMASYHTASSFGHLALLQLLADRCPAVRDSVKTDGRILGSAAHQGHLDVVTWLVEQGADHRWAYTCKDGVIRTAAELAKWRGHTAAAAYLRGQEKLARETEGAAARAAARARVEAAVGAELEAREAVVQAAAAEAEREEAARRARNEKRRQNQKKAKARRRAAAAAE